VLPFVNLSSDPEQEFFSDGMTEEITSVLAKIPDLRVVGRTSAFQFKGQNQDLRAIGQALAVTHLLEGSVRKEGNRLRINAELIQVGDGVHVWTESYDRQLTDIFAIQEDIARTITASLRVPLGLKPGENLVNNRGLDPASYEKFLRAKAVIRGRGGPRRLQLQPITDATALLEPIVARYPDFAPAWGQLAGAYQRLPERLPNATVEEKRRAVNERLLKAEAAAKRAIALDANLPDGYSSLGLTMAYRGRLLQADELLTKALALDRFYPEALHIYANLLGAVGRFKEALAMREQLLSIDPLVPIYRGPMEVLLWIDGQTDTSIATLKARGSPFDLAALNARLARAYAEMGRYGEAIDTLRAIPQGSFPDGMVEAAVRLLRTAPAAAGSPQSLPRLSYPLDFVYLHIGVPERVLQPFEDDVAAGSLPTPRQVIDFWLPSYAPLRKTARFKALARNVGLVEYWRAKGWPDLCRPIGTDDFACE
jgi:TolB-like protein